MYRSLSSKPQVFQLIGSIVTCILLASCGLSDLRNETLKRGITSDLVQKGKAIINQCVRAHGWDSIDSAEWLEVTYMDDWSGANFIGSFFNPWPAESQMVKHQLPLHSFKTSRTILLNDNVEQEIWGIFGGVTYKITYNGLSKAHDDDIHFFLPAIEYFLKIPMMMTEVPLVAHMGDTLYEGVRYELVFGTWESMSPTKKFDQYLYWINSRTHLLEFVEYTIREKGDFIVGSMFFTDFKKVERLTVPFTLKVVSEPYSDKGLLHEIAIKDLTLHNQPAPLGA